MNRRRAGVILLAVGACLLSLTILGRWTGLGRYESFPARSWERFDPALAEATHDLDSLYRAAEARATGPLRDMPPGEAMRIIYETVADRFTHGDRATYSPFSNWVMWTLGAAKRRYRDIQEPDALLRGGHSALCGDVSFVLMRLAEKAGIRPRHDLLEGHIIMEAWYYGSWHAYDPDLEVVVRDDSGVVLGTDILAGRPDIIRRNYSGRGDSAFVEQVENIYVSEDDNIYVEYPARNLFGPRGQRPGRMEQAGRLAAWILPGCMIAAGVALAAGGRNKRTPA